MKLYVIGIGPGGEEQMTLRAVRALEACECGRIWSVFRLN